MEFVGCVEKSTNCSRAEAEEGVAHAEGLIAAIEFRMSVTGPPISLREPTVMGNVRQSKISWLAEIQPSTVLIQACPFGIADRNRTGEDYG